MNPPKDLNNVLNNALELVVLSEGEYYYIVNKHSYEDWVKKHGPVSEENIVKFQEVPEIICFESIAAGWTHNKWARYGLARTLVDKGSPYIKIK